MKKITLLLIAVLPLLCFGQSYYYNFDTVGDFEGFTQGGIPSLDVTGGALVASDTPTAFSGGFQQIRTPEGLGLVEGDYTIVRLVVENLLTETATPGNHETFRIVNYDIGDSSPGNGTQSGNITIPYGSGFQTLDFAIPSNPDNAGVLDRVGLRIQLGSGSGLAGTLRIDQFIIVNTLSVNIATNGDFENNGGELAPWIANGPDVSASLIAGNGGGSAGRLTFDQNATTNNTLQNSFFTFSATELEQVSTVTVNFDAKSNNATVTVGVQISHSIGGGSVVNQFNGNETLTSSWAPYSINRGLSADFDQIRVDLRVKTNAASASLGDTFDFDNVSVIVDYYDLTVAPAPSTITSAQDGVWNDTATWNGGFVPDMNSDVQIDHVVTINGDREANDVTIINPGSILINKGRSLTVNGNLVTDATVNNSIVVRGDSDQFSSLIVNGTSTGDIRFRRYVSDSPDNDLISPPVNISSFVDFYSDNASFFVEDINSDQVLFGPFDNSAIVNDYVNLLETDASALTQGVGYRMGTTGLALTSALNFHGTVETDIVTVPISAPAGGSPWNLVGNPYSSYLNFKDFFDLLTDFNGVVVGANNQLDTSFTAVYGYDSDDVSSSLWTIWDFNNPNYATDNITPGQGFFVRSKTGGGTVTFNPSMRTIGTTDDFIVGRDSENENFASGLISLTTSSDTYSTNLFFRDFNTLGLDPGFDTGAYNQGNSGIYTELVEDNTGVSMVNQSLPYSDLSNVVVPVVININQGVQFSISLDMVNSVIPSSTEIYLDDTVLNTSTLLNSGDYTLTPSSNLSGSGRFYLRFADSALSTGENEFDTIQVFALNKIVHVKGSLDSETELVLYDIQGRIVNKNDLNEGVIDHKVDVSHLTSGVYVIELRGNGQKLAKKLVIN